MKDTDRVKIENSTNKRLCNIVLIFIVLTICFIWVNSMLPGDTSSSESGFVMGLITPVLELFVGKGNVTMYMVRKLAHFTEYFVLGAELSVYAVLSRRILATGTTWLQIVLPLAAGLVIASIDETIQIFSSERGPSVKDVLLDFTGVFTAVLIVRIIVLIVHASNSTKSNQINGE